MRKLLISTILILSACAATFAQADKISPCPTIDVSSPPTIINGGEIETFTAALSNESERPNLKYKWTVTRGKIIDGQGTLKLRVLKKAEDAGSSNTATLEIIGLPKECANIVSASEQICECIYPFKVDEFSIPIFRSEKERLDSLRIGLTNNPSAQLFVLISHKENTSKKAVAAKEQEILDTLAEVGIENARVSLVSGFAKTELIQFWIVPAGATPPTCEDCILPDNKTKSTCPTIEVIGPAGVTVAGEPITFTANVTSDDADSLVYNWTVSDGTIIEGLGTPVIKVATNSEMGGTVVTAVVEIEGLSIKCKKTAWAEAQIPDVCYLPRKTDEYEHLPFKDEKPRLANVAVELKQDANSVAFFIIYVGEKDTYLSVKTRVDGISKYLTNIQKIPVERFQFVFSKAEAQRTVIYVFPSGETAPIPEEDAIKLEDLKPLPRRARK